MNLIRTTLLVSVAVVCVWAFVPRALQAQSPAPSAAGSAAAAAPIVDTDHFAYLPATLTVAPGTKVVFKNSDSIAHTVTANDKSFDSGNMDQGKTWSHVFAKAGTYTYFCAYHTYMQGKIVVQ